MSSQAAWEDPSLTVYIVHLFLLFFLSRHNKALIYISLENNRIEKSNSTDHICLRLLAYWRGWCPIVVLYWYLPPNHIHIFLFREIRYYWNPECSTALSAVGFDWFCQFLAWESGEQCSKGKRGYSLNLYLVFETIGKMLNFWARNMYEKFSKLIRSHTRGFVTTQLSSVQVSAITKLTITTAASAGRNL